MVCKLFLGGVSPSITNEDICAHFSKYGPVSDAVVMRERGFGFVTFETQDGADAALAQPQQTIDGQTIDVKHAVGKGGGSRGGGGGGGPPPGKGGPSGVTDKVFVGGLPQDCSDDKIRDYFQAYGNIVDAVVMKDRDTGRSRGFGFVQFDSSGPVEKVMQEYAAHKIEGKWVEVKRSIPRDQMPPPPARSEGGGRSGGSDHACAGGCDVTRGSGGSASGGRSYGYEMPPAYGGAYVGGGYGGYGAYGAYGGYGYTGYPGACGYGAGYLGVYSMPPPTGYAYGMDPYASGYGYGKGSNGGRSSPY